MGLPVIQHATYEHFLIGLNKPIKYRPFTNKEQKILLLAKEAKGSDNESVEVQRAIRQVLELCTMGTVDVDRLCTFDVEDLFLRIRAKSVGEVVDVRYRYDYEEDGKKVSKFIDVKVNLDEVKVITHPEHERKIMVTDSVGVMMRYPTFADLSKFKSDDDLAIGCIEYIFDENETYSPGDYTREELVRFFDDFDAEALNAVRKFFITAPRLKHEIEIDLPNGKKETVKFVGLEDFFI